jgi:hypothetical protein
MSAIIAGEKCKLCSKRYFVSMGHPDWFDNVIKRRKEPCSIYRRYVRIAKSGICTFCLTGKVEPHVMAVATFRLVQYGRKIKRR